MNTKYKAPKLGVLGQAFEGSEPESATGELQKSPKTHGEETPSFQLRSELYPYSLSDPVALEGLSTGESSKLGIHGVQIVIPFHLHPAGGSKT